ncbi:hypothetical protein [uncultured Methylobacterium sp.]|jgi:hypothetical protein|uniref:hypothetical protein n=1 Tax=uncultured Methylobacterium sp. TaxID=157278 RepID=UPI00262D0FB7|nr:hypothetical protein [uncultured Methylobacterium sp.]
MKTFWAMAAVGLTLAGSLGPATAQWGGSDYGYGERRPDYGYGERRPDYGYRERRPDYGYDGRDDGPRGRSYGRGEDYDDRGRGRRGQRGDYAFDEGEYLRCNPDVRRAVVNGQMESGLKHYRVHGQREGRKLTC